LHREKRQYTYADYLAWDENERIEIIDGIPYHTYGGEIIEGGPVMQAAPSRSHQEISGELYRQLANFLRGKSCKVYSAPFAVRLNADGDDDTAIEPDISVVCDRFRLDDRGCKGAPDLIAEVLSPSTARKDRIIKFNKYLRAGVREYWLVDPDTRTVQVCLLKDGLYFVSGYTDADTAPVDVLPGCMINLRDVFAE
jgi:Uma2 family endonuclease